MNRRTIVLVGLFMLSIFYFIRAENINDTNINQTKHNEISEIELKNIAASSSSTPYKVLRVVDGDTILISYEGNDEKIRMIGVNTPESVDPRKKVECFGKEASTFTKNLLSNRNVSIVFDETQDKRDKYGRLLAYVYLDDGILVNQEIIDKGYGYEYTYKYPYKLQSTFKRSQRNAELNKVGLWADDACIIK